MNNLSKILLNIPQINNYINFIYPQNEKSLTSSKQYTQLEIKAENMTKTS